KLRKVHQLERDMMEACAPGDIGSETVVVAIINGCRRVALVRQWCELTEANGQRVRLDRLLERRGAKLARRRALPERWRRALCGAERRPGDSPRPRQRRKRP